MNISQHGIILVVVYIMNIVENIGAATTGSVAEVPMMKVVIIPGVGTVILIVVTVVGVVGDNYFCVVAKSDVIVRSAEVE